ncbi:hypothetical protein TRFO_11397 [Tritrichomonas foetus]|uniref:Uncharacterized protein n=1 Tax=Tritrichomonas foetus TaxID=1144522 RepID=A0A1J4J8V1_9EUKA|nr:hypothetical protein TRFO_11397 [Tritrichomonas foetus]|eukprot:OHS94115.1 hypothetical protein TRFO_11397 [Tritrichomonas foetus]
MCSFNFILNEHLFNFQHYEKMSETENETFPIILNDVYAERKDSIIHTFHAIFEDFSTDSKSDKFRLSKEQIQSILDQIINKNLNLERERFLSYLIYLISDIAKLNNLKDPKFIGDFYLEKKKFDRKYDSDGQLLNILQTFRSNPINPNFPRFKSFFALFLGFSFDATLMKSTLFDLRKIVMNTMKSVFRILKKERKKIEIVSNSFTRTDDLKSEKLKRKINKLQSKREQECNFYQQSMNSFENQLQQAKKIINNYKKFRLKIEGDLLNIIRQVESLEEKEVVNTPDQVTLGELKKHTNQLIEDIQVTTESLESSKSFLNDNNFSNDSSFKMNFIQQLKEKDEVIKHLKNQLKNTVSTLDIENTLSQNKLSPTHTVTVDSTVKLNKMLMKTSLDFRKALSEKQEMSEIIQNQKSQIDSFLSLKSDIERANNEKKALKEQIVELTEVNKSLKEKNKLMKQKIEEQNQHFESLTQKVSNLKERIEKQKSIEFQGPSNEMLKNLKGSLLIEQITEKTNLLIESENKIQDLQKENMRLANENETLHDTQKFDQNKIESLKENIKSLKEQLDDRDEQYRDLRSSLSGSNLEKLEKKLQSSLDEKNNFQKQLHKLTQHYQKLRDIVKEVKNTNYSLNEENNSLKYQINDIKKAKKQQEVDNFVLKKKVEKISKRSLTKKQISQLVKEYPNIITFGNDLKHTVESLAESIQNISIISQDKEKRNEELRQSKEMLEFKLIQQQEIINKLQDENERISSYYKDLLGRINKVAQCQEEKDIPDITQQIFEERNKLKENIDEINELLNSENEIIENESSLGDKQKQDFATGLVDKIKYLLYDQKHFNQVKEIINCNSNDNISKVINDMVTSENIVSKIKETIQNNTPEEIEEKVKIVNSLNKLFNVHEGIQLVQSVSKLHKDSILISSILGADQQQKNIPKLIKNLREKIEEFTLLFDQLHQFIYFENNEELLKQVIQLLRMKNGVKKLIPFETNKELLQQIRQKLMEIVKLREKVAISKEFLSEIIEIFPEVNPNEVITKIKETKTKADQFKNRISQLLNIEQANENTEEAIIKQVELLRNSSQIIFQHFPESEDLIDTINHILAFYDISEAISKEIHNFVEFEDIPEILSLLLKKIPESSVAFQTEEEEEEEEGKEIEEEELKETDECEEDVDTIYEVVEEETNENESNNCENMKHDTFVEGDIPENIYVEEEGNIDGLNHVIIQKLPSSSLKETPSSNSFFNEQLTEYKVKYEQLNKEMTKFISEIAKILDISQDNNDFNHDIITKKIIKLVNSHQLLRNIQAFFENVNERDIPQTIKGLIEENNQKIQEINVYSDTFAQLKEIIGAKSLTRNDLLESVRQIKNENAQLDKLIVQLQESVQFDRNGEIASFLKELIENNQNNPKELEIMLKKIFPTQKINTIFDDVQTLKDDFNATVEELQIKHKTFVDSVQTSLSSFDIASETDIPAIIAKLVKENAIFRKDNHEINQFFENIKPFIKFNNNTDLSQKIEKLFRLKKRVKVVMENLPSVKNIEEIPGFINEIQNETQNFQKKYDSLMKKIYSLSNENEEGKAIITLSKIIDKATILESDLNRAMRTQNSTEAMSKLRNIIEDSKSIDTLRSSLIIDIDTIPTEIIRYKNLTDSLKTEISNLQNEVQKKISDISQYKSIQAGVYCTLASIFECPPKDTEIIKCATEMKNKVDENRKLNDGLKSQIIDILGIDHISEFPDKISDIIEDNKELTNELSELKEKIAHVKNSFSCDDFTTIPEVYNKMKESKSKIKDSYNRFLKQVASTLQETGLTSRAISSKVESQLIDSINQLRISNGELSDKLKISQNILSDIKDIVQIDDLKNLPEYVRQMYDENNNVHSAASYLNCDILDLDNEIKQMKQSNATKQVIIDKIGECFGVKTNGNDELTPKLLDKAQKYKDKKNIIMSLLKTTKCPNIENLHSKIAQIIEKNNDTEEKNAESENELIKLRSYIDDLQSSFRDVSSSDIMNIPTEMLSLKNENEKLKQNNIVLTNNFKKFQDQITDGLKIWKSQSPEEIIESIKDLKKSSELESTKHNNLIDKLSLMINFDDPDQIPSFVQKIVNDNHAMDAKLKRFSQIQSTFGDIEMDDAPRILSQCRSSLKNKSDQFDELSSKYQRLLNGIREIISFNNENEIVNKLHHFSISAKEDKAKYENLKSAIQSVPFLSNHSFSVENDPIKVMDSMKKQLTEKNESERLFSDIQNIVKSKNVTDLLNDIRKIQNDAEKYSNIVNSLKQYLPFDQEDRFPSLIKNLVESLKGAEDQIKIDHEIFEKLKENVDFYSPDQLPFQINKMKNELQKASNITNSLTSTLKLRSPDDLPQKIDQLMNDYQKLTDDHSNLTKKISNIIDPETSNSTSLLFGSTQETPIEILGNKIETIKNKLKEKNSEYDALHDKYYNFVGSIGRIVRETTEESILKQVYENVEKIKAMERGCQSHLETLNSLKRILSVNNDDTLVKTVQKLFNSTKQLKSTVAQIVDENLPLSKDVSISDLSTHIVSFQAEFDAIRGKFDQVKRMLQVTDDDKLFDSLFALTENHKQLVYQLLNLTKVQKEEDIVAYVKKLILEHDNLIHELCELEGINRSSDMNKLKSAVINDKKCLSKVKKIIDASDEDDLIHKIQQMKDTMNDISETTGMNDANKIAQTVKRVFSTFDDGFGSQKSVENAENRQKIIHDLIEVSNTNNIEEMKLQMIKSRKILNELKGITGTLDDDQIVPEIKSIIDTAGNIPLPRKSANPFSMTYPIKRPKIQNIRDSIEMNRNLAESLQKEMKTNNNDEIVGKMREMQNFINSIKNITGIENEDDIVHHISELLNQIGHDSNHFSKPSLSNALSSASDTRKVIDKIKKEANIDDSEKAVSQLIKKNRIVNDLMKLTNISNEDQLIPQLEDILNAAHSLSEYQDDLNQVTALPRTSKPMNLPTVKSSIERNRRFSNKLRNSLNIADNDDAAALKMIKYHKIVEELKNITGIDDESKIVSEIEDLLNSVPSNDFEPNDFRINSSRGYDKISMLKNSFDNNRKLADSLKNAVNDKSGNKASDKLHQWQSIINELKSFTNSNDDYEILPKIRSLIEIADEINVNKYSRNSQFSKNQNDSRLDDIKQSILNNKRLVDNIRIATNINGDDDMLLNSLSSKSRLVEDLKKITGTNDESLIAQQIREIYSSNGSNQRLMQELQDAAKVNDPKTLKQVVHLVNDLKGMVQTDDIEEIKEKLSKYHMIIKKLLIITGIADPALLPDQISTIFKAVNISSTPSKLIIEQMAQSIENNQRFINELYEMFHEINLSSLKESVKRYFSIINDLSKFLQLVDENQIYPTVSKMKQALTELRILTNSETNDQIKGFISRYKGLMISISAIINSNNDSELIDKLKNFVMIQKRYSILLDVLKQYLTFSKEEEIPQVADNILKQAQIDRNFVNHLLMLIKESDQIDIKFDENLSTNIVEWFIKYLKKCDIVMADYTKFMDSAAVYGYQGESSLEASEFLIEYSIKKRKHEIMESAHDEIENLRKNSDEKIKLVEKRNSDLREALSEARKLKQEAQQSVVDMQNESLEREITLQNDITELNNTISNWKTILHELVRLAAGLVYDKTIINNGLTQEEKKMLNII